MRAVAEVWNEWVDEMTGEGTPSITEQDRLDAQEVVVRFSQTLKGSCILTKLERMYNAELEERYAASKERIASQRQIVSDSEVIMFHGTSPHNVDK